MAVSRVLRERFRSRSVFCIERSMKPEPNRRAGLDAESHAAVQRGLQILDSCAITVRYQAGQEIGHEPDQVERWYRIVSGVARKCVVLPNGRRQILDLLLAGDFFGIDSQPPQQHCYCESVVDGTVVACYARRDVEALTEADPRVSKAVRDLAFRAISRLQTQLLIRGRTTATAKVGSFLLNMEHRLNDQPPGAVELPMSRTDIADYLAISVETVSRALTGLRDRGAIQFSGARRLTIVDPVALEVDQRRDAERGIDEIPPPLIGARVPDDKRWS
jgi:CRP-like cAMP-binding protein